LAEKEKKFPQKIKRAYCQARQRLSENFLSKIFSKVGEKLEEEVKDEQLWCGRHVKVFDGSTVSMPDTPANQKAYPQPSSQKEGCGFPIAKIGVFFSLTTGAALAIVVEVFKTHDVKLARRLYQFLNPLDVLVGDRAVCSYADINQIKARGADAVFRKHQGRKNQMRKGKRIGPNDKLVTWDKPKSRPEGLSKEEYEALPPSLTVREIHYYVCIPGWRTKEVTVITTLLDEKAYPRREIAKLYKLRWEVELDLRHLKTTLKMEVLRSKTPAMVRKEISVYLLAYNLLRTVMWEAGTQKGVNPIRNTARLRKRRKMYSRN
jgi:hypothetical protein